MGLLIFEDCCGHIVNCAGFGDKRLMSKGFALFAVSADRAYSVKDWEGTHESGFSPAPKQHVMVDLKIKSQ